LNKANKDFFYSISKGLFCISDTAVPSTPLGTALTHECSVFVDR
jgi:hypothetical protein